MAANDTTVADEDGDDSDWIEIYNFGETAIELDGWSLTEPASGLTRVRRALAM